MFSLCRLKWRRRAIANISSRLDDKMRRLRLKHSSTRGCWYQFICFPGVYFPSHYGPWINYIFRTMTVRTIMIHAIWFSAILRSVSKRFVTFRHMTFCNITVQNFPFCILTVHQIIFRRFACVQRFVLWSSINI